MSVTVECRKLYESDNAVKILIEATGELIWIPLSQVESMHFDGKGEGSIVLTDWIAEQKSLA